MTIIKKSGEDVEKRGSSYTVIGNITSYNYREQYGGSSKAKNRTHTRSSNHTPGHISEKTIVQKDTCTPVFIVILFTVARTCSVQFSSVQSLSRVRFFVTP